MLEGVSESEEKVNPPLPPLVEFPKPEGLDFNIVAIGIGAGLGLGLLGKALGLSGHDQIASFLSSINVFRPVGLLLAIAGAESILLFQVLGQILFSKIVGWKVVAVSLGPLKLSLQTRRWRFALTRSILSHSVVSVPVSSLSPSWRLFIVLAAAPFCLALGAAISLLAYVQFSGHAWLRGYVAAATLFGSAVVLVSLLPSARSARVWNSARFCFALLKKDPELRDRLTTIRLLGLTQQRQRPRDIPIDLIAAAAQPATDVMGAVMRASTISNWCLDRKDLASAGAWYARLAELAQFCPPATKNAALASSACFYLAWREDRQNAIRSLTEVNPELLATNVHRLCTQALIHILAGERSRAETVIALAEADCSGPFGDYQRETLERLRTIAEAIETRSHPSEAPR